MAKEIRLLRFENNPDSDNIGYLETVDLSNAPPYYCLSHSWGSQPRNVPISINGEVKHLSSDLVCGLKMMRNLAHNQEKFNPPLKYLWLDTICVNQEDIPERKSQIKLMAKIYSGAIRTIIWLGPDINFCSTAWKLVDILYDHFRLHHPIATTLIDIPSRLYSDKLHLEAGLPPWSSELWSHLRQLMESKWFSRTWIIQEVALSREDPIILHGTHLYPWERLGWAAGWLRRSGYIRLPQIPEAILNVDTLCNIQRSQRKWPLDTLLIITQIKFRATDQRDKIYGLLGLAEEYQDPLTAPDVLQPDYDIRVEDLYQRVGRYLLKKKRSLSILTRAHGTNRVLTSRQRLYDLSTLPSWLPDWGDFRLFGREIHKSLSWVHYFNSSDPPRLGFSTHYKATGESLLTIQDTLDDTTLRVGVIKVDTIDKAVSCNGSTITNDDFKKSFSSNMVLILEAAWVLQVTQNMAVWTEQFIKATTAEQHQLSGRSWDQTLKDGAAYLHSLLVDPAFKSAQSSLASASDKDSKLQTLEQLSAGGDAEQYLALAYNYCFNRSFIVTSQGRMGIAPLDTAHNDQVGLIQGGGVPYILRTLNGQVHFVGDAYVAGLMNGEGMVMLDAGIYKEEAVDIH